VVVGRGVGQVHPLDMDDAPARPSCGGSTAS
jgi:hypothetical protein